jgi:hypothetical protein
MPRWKLSYGFHDVMEVALYRWMVYLIETPIENG